MEEGRVDQDVDETHHHARRVQDLPIEQHQLVLKGLYVDLKRDLSISFTRIMGHGLFSFFLILSLNKRSEFKKNSVLYAIVFF